MEAPRTALLLAFFVVWCGTVSGQTKVYVDPITKKSPNRSYGEVRLYDFGPQSDVYIDMIDGVKIAMKVRCRGKSVCEGDDGTFYRLSPGRHALIIRLYNPEHMSSRVIRSTTGTFGGPMAPRTVRIDESLKRKVPEINFTWSEISIEVRAGYYYYPIPENGPPKTGWIIESKKKLSLEKQIEKRLAIGKNQALLPALLQARFVTDEELQRSGALEKQ